MSYFETRNDAIEMVWISNSFRASEFTLWSARWFGKRRIVVTRDSVVTGYELQGVTYFYGYINRFDVCTCRKYPLVECKAGEHIAARRRRND